MKALAVGLVALMPSSALAASLPITGHYCGDGGFSVDARGVGWETATAYVQCIAEKDSVLQSSTSVCLTHSDVPKKLTATIKEDEVAGTLAYTDDDRGTIILNQCPN